MHASHMHRARHGRGGAEVEIRAQGGKLQIGAPTGNWLMVVVYRGKHDPVSKP